MVLPASYSFTGEGGERVAHGTCPNRLATPTRSAVQKQTPLGRRFAGSVAEVALPLYVLAPHHFFFGAKQPLKQVAGFCGGWRPFFRHCHGELSAGFTCDGHMLCDALALTPAVPSGGGEKGHCKSRVQNGDRSPPSTPLSATPYRVRAPSKLRTAAGLPPGVQAESLRLSDKAASRLFPLRRLQRELRKVRTPAGGVKACENT